jgi:hypothetical protein
VLTKSEIVDLITNAVAAEVTARGLAITAEATARGTAITAEVTARGTAITTAVSDEATARGIAITTAVSNVPASKGSVVAAFAHCSGTAGHSRGSWECQNTRNGDKGCKVQFGATSCACPSGSTAVVMHRKYRNYGRLGWYEMDTMCIKA